MGFFSSFFLSSPAESLRFLSHGEWGEWGEWGE
jgi:hypothetical protein